MRFPEDKIKEAILHPDLEIRDRATDYFAKLPTDSASLRFFRQRISSSWASSKPSKS